MGAHLDKLVSIASAQLGRVGAPLPAELLGQAGSHAAGLRALLGQKNGFMAFESALHVFPAGSTPNGYSIEQWNAPSLWRAAYGDAAADGLFFAEDIFGEQFCLRSSSIWRFNPETGDSEELAATLEEWAARLLQDYDGETGYPLAHAWQERHGPLPLDRRLLPKIPFVAGGKYALENLYAAEAVEGMKFRAELARQIRNLPDGTPIRFEITDD